MLTEKEITVSVKLQKLVPLLEQFIEQKNPSEFAKWGNNCCLQTAFLCAYILRQELPEYTWQIKEGHFIHPTKGIYNHGYVVGESNKGRKLLVDLARHPIWEDLFMEITDINEPYVNTHITDEVVKVDTHSYSEMISMQEYFTQLQGRKFIREFLRYAEKEMIN